MKLLMKGKQYRYLGGLFIPLEKLLSEALKKSRNVLKTLPGIDYIDNKHPVDGSFGANCFSEAPALKFSSNYESANLFAVVRV